METEINKKSETVIITVDYKELTYLWTALDLQSIHLKLLDNYSVANECVDLSRQLLIASMKLNFAERVKKVTNYCAHDV